MCAKLRTAMLLLLGLLGGANSTLLVSSINTLLTYLQVNSSLLFTSNNTIANISQIYLQVVALLLLKSWMQDSSMFSALVSSMKSAVYDSAVLHWKKLQIFIGLLDVGKSFYRGKVRQMVKELSLIFLGLHLWVI